MPSRTAEEICVEVVAGTRHEGMTIARVTSLQTSIKATPIWRRLRDIKERWRSIAEIHQWTKRDEEMLVFYSRFVKSDEICFDIGANRGNRAKVFQKLGARLVAVEPQARCARILRRAFANDPRVTVVEAACGETQGSSEIAIATVDTVSSMAKGWIEAVKTTGRFGEVTWVETQACKMTTLDLLIAEYGSPVFIKIDVEGFEINVLQGLTKPVPCLSFEYTPELVSNAIDCVQYLAELGSSEFTFSIGESMALPQHWYSAEEIVNRLQSGEGEFSLFGDIYARAQAS